VCELELFARFYSYFLAFYHFGSKNLSILFGPCVLGTVCHAFFIAEHTKCQRRHLNNNNSSTTIQISSISSPVSVSVYVSVSVSVAGSCATISVPRFDICLHIYVSQLVARLPSSSLVIPLPPPIFISLFPTVALALASVHFISHLAVAAFPFLCLPAIHSRPLAVFTGSWRW